jgi:hypothetical protein
MNAGSNVALGGVLGTHNSEGFSGNPPTAWWKMDENIGSTSTYDSSGNGRTASFGASTAAPTWVTGKQGSGLKFDGTNDYLSTAAAIDLSSVSTITVEFWLNWDAYADNDDLAMEFSTNYNANTDSFMVKQVNQYEPIFFAMQCVAGYNSAEFARLQ